VKKFTQPENGTVTAKLIQPPNPPR